MSGLTKNLPNAAPTTELGPWPWFIVVETRLSMFFFPGSGYTSTSRFSEVRLQNDTYISRTNQYIIITFANGDRILKMGKKLDSSGAMRPPLKISEGDDQVILCAYVRMIVQTHINHHSEPRSLENCHSFPPECWAFVCDYLHVDSLYFSALCTLCRHLHPPPNNCQFQVQLTQRALQVSTFQSVQVSRDIFVNRTC